MSRVTVLVGVSVLLSSTYYVGCSRDIDHERSATISDLDIQAFDIPVASERVRGAGMGGDRYEKTAETPVVQVADQPLSTFSVDVDTASYANVRRYLLDRRLPDKDAVRIEEMVNYFRYAYPSPERDAALRADLEVAVCPWEPSNHLVRIGLQGRRLARGKRPPSNLVFLLDVSGSMHGHDRLPLLKQGLISMLDGLTERDRVAVVVYAGASGVVLPSTPACHREQIGQAIVRLQAGGATNGGQGIQLAYDIAQQNYVEGGVNRVILATDGDFNVGTTSKEALIRLVEERAQAEIFLTVLGFGRGNLNDSMMEQISNRGNGFYAYIDSAREARRVLIDQLDSTLLTIAKDVKIQVEFNPAVVESYRLVGYENRMLKAHDFNNDHKDAGEMGAGHQVTALYQIVPVAGPTVSASSSLDELVFQPSGMERTPNSEDLLFLKVRFKEPNDVRSRLLTFRCENDVKPFDRASAEFQFASAVAEFGMLLRGSKHVSTLSFGQVLDHTIMGLGFDGRGDRAEFVELVRIAQSLTSRQLAYGK